MCIAPNLTERAARARADLRMGVPIVIADTLVAAIETLSDDRFSVLQAMPDVSIALTRRRAETLKARVYDGDLTRVALPRDVSVAWAHAIADPAHDLEAPFKGPLNALRDGQADAARTGLALCKAARLLPAVITAPVAADHPVTHDLTALPLSVGPLLDQRSALERIVSANLPLEVSEAGRLHVFRPEDGSEEHYAIEIGKPDRSTPVLARLHSACFTGDLLGSLKCDCGPQLRGALGQMGEEGAGVLLYLNQEGRGIGLANKMRAYALQDQGFDTVEANHRLGFEDDERDFRLGSDILQALGVRRIRLLTNNPAKVAMMEKSGVQVAERVPLRVGETRFNRDYLSTKAQKSGHIL